MIKTGDYRGFIQMQIIDTCQVMFLLMMAKAVCSTVLTLFLPALRGPITASSVSEKEDLSRCRL